MPTVRVPEGLALGVASWSIVGGVLGAVAASATQDTSGPFSGWARISTREGAVVGASMGALFIVAVVLVFGAD